MEFLAAISDPEHPERESLLAWTGGPLTNHLHYRHGSSNPGRSNAVACGKASINNLRNSAS
jgi:hypothetical protein